MCTQEPHFTTRPLHPEDHTGHQVLFSPYLLIYTMPPPLSKPSMPEVAKAKSSRPDRNSTAGGGVSRKDPPRSNNPSSNITRQALELKEQIDN